MGGERRGGRREPRKIRPGGMSKSRRRLERVVDSEWIMVEENDNSGDFCGGYIHKKKVRQLRRGLRRMSLNYSLSAVSSDYPYMQSQIL
jgi:hypothetical protein